MQYLYVGDDGYNFMDQNSYEQLVLTKSQVEDVLSFLKEQIAYTVLYWNDAPISVTPPIHMDFEVMETPPGVKGDTAQGAGTKPATLETGIVVQVPLFVVIGDLVRVDTRTGDYVERVKKPRS